MSNSNKYDIGFGPLKPLDALPSSAGGGFIWSQVGMTIARGGSHRLYTDTATLFKFCRVAVSEAPTGQSIKVDVMRNLLTSILDAPVEIAIGGFTALAIPSVKTTAGDHLTVTVLQVGTTYTGRDLTVRLY